MCGNIFVLELYCKVQANYVSCNIYIGGHFSVAREGKRLWKLHSLSVSVFPCLSKSVCVHTCCMGICVCIALTCSHVLTCD